MRVQKNSKGFTLVEVLIAITILALLTAPLLANLVTSSKINTKSKLVMNGTTVAQNIMEGITAYGVENTIVQLENTTTLPLELAFIPQSMQPENWGRAVVSVDGTTNLPVYATDRYQDEDNSPLLQYSSLESGVFLDGTTTVNAGYTHKYSKVGADGKSYFVTDENTHAYMFWMKNVKYGSKKYDVLLTIDANEYRGTDTLDTTTSVSSYSSRDALADDINDSSHDFSKDRNYNSEKLAKVISSIGTDVAQDDTISDRFYMEPTNDLDNAVSNLLIYCKSGTTEDDVKAKLRRDIYIKIRQEANSADPTKPYTVIGVQYKYTITDSTMLQPMAATDTYVESEQIVFKSCEKDPRNIFFYYIPNYEPFVSGSGADSENIYITNEGNLPYGKSLSLYIIRQCKDSDTSGTGLTQLVNNESRYKVNVSLDETLLDSDPDNIQTLIYTNIDTDLSDDMYKGDGWMGRYKLNGTPCSGADMKVAPMNSKNTTLVSTTDEDYLYSITVQVFRPDCNFNSEARIAKFTGSSN